MAQLSDDQRQFLDINEIPLSAVFDATGLKRSDYRLEMKELQKLVAYGVSPCRKKGHTLRTRAGHCAQCDPLKLVYLLRHIDAGMLYVAGSSAGKFIKVGSAVDAHKRISTLNSWKYASQNDWELISSFKCKKAGSAEYFVQKGISDFAYPTKYFREGKELDCLETFKCKYSRVLVVLNSLNDFDLDQNFSDTELEIKFDNVEEEFGKHIRVGNIHNAEDINNSSVEYCDFPDDTDQMGIDQSENIAQINYNEKNLRIRERTDEALGSFGGINSANSSFNEAPLADSNQIASQKFKKYLKSVLLILMFLCIIYYLTSR